MKEHTLHQTVLVVIQDFIAQDLQLQLSLVLVLLVTIAQVEPQMNSKTLFQLATFL